MPNEKIQLFEKQPIRALWDEDAEKWWFSVLDVIAVLTDQAEYKKTRNYWKWLKNKLKEEGSEVVSHTNQLKLLAPDGKMRTTDVADSEQVLRLIQSIPSPKAEPFKMWLAKVGSERLDEIQNPELTIDRAMLEYRALGYSEEWINARLQSIQFRKELTDQWKKSGVQEGIEYAVLTNLMTKEWSGKTVAEYKKYKGLKKENLRDNMTGIELALNILAEASATEISKIREPEGFNESQSVALDGAKVAKEARKNIENKTGQPAVSNKNAKSIHGRIGNILQLPENEV